MYIRYMQNFGLSRRLPRKLWPKRGKGGGGQVEKGKPAEGCRPVAVFDHISGHERGLGEVL